MDDPTTPLEQLRATFREHLLLPDPSVVDFTVAVAVANRLGGDPVWAFVVAPPSSGKTETLQSLTRLAEVYPMSSLTANTFLSGAKKAEKDGKSASLLERLPNGTLLMLKDFGTILSLREDARAEILSQLREIYDGSLVKDFGTGRHIEWHGRLGFMAGTTPAIDVHHAVIATLGERFLYFRAPAADRKETSRRSLHVRDEAEMRGELQVAVFEFMRDLDLTERPEVAGAVEDRIVNVADIVTWARTAVYRDRFTRDIEVAPEPEGAPRFAKQLGSLWRALTVMGHEDPLALVCRVALDSMPPARSAALTKLATAGIVSSTDLRKVTRLSQSASRRVLEDLEALRLVEIVEHGGAGVASTWGLTDNGLLTWKEGFADYLDSLPQYQGRGERGEDIENVDVAGATSGGWMSLLAP
ncbi:MAG: hypothetical protein M3P11_12930 [Actinomycetota bacterium]|nr:hypothetical protein [Actinomycetota bacterium]MDP9331527.1 hypothetical protein [Actinomycetota bacterium]